MNTARIVVLTMAAGAAACPASGADSSGPSRLALVKPKQARTRDRAPLSLNRVAALDIIPSSPRDQVSRRGDGINVTTQK